MRKGRLDAILLRDGAVTEEQVRKALLRQKSRGGKLGAHLLWYGFVSEEALVRALMEQMGGSGVRLEGRAIPPDALAAITADLAESIPALPLKIDREKGEFLVAVPDPSDSNVVASLKRASGFSKIVLFVAAESVLRERIAQLYRGRKPDPSRTAAIDMPDLFGGEEAAQGAPTEYAETPPCRYALLLTRQVFLKTVLPSVLEREGIRLSVASTAEQAAEALAAQAAERLLVTDDARDEYARLAAARRGRDPLPVPTFLKTVGRSLFENPASYDSTVAPLLATARLLAEQRCASLPAPPAFALVESDIEALGTAVGLSRLTLDGLRLAALLLQPDKVTSGADPLKTGFGDLAGSARLASRIAFPWDVEGCLRALADRLGAASGSIMPTDDIETVLAAGVLGVVWARHAVSDAGITGQGADSDARKSRIRDLSGRLASSSTVEAYLRIVERGDRSAPAGGDVFLVGDLDGTCPGLAADLRHHGFRVVESETAEEALTAYARRRPVAAIVLVDASPSPAEPFRTGVRRDACDDATPLFAVTRRNDPSSVLTLLEGGFDDVLTLPSSATVIAARVARAVVGRAKGTAPSTAHGIAGTFRDLSFPDLVQSLAGGRKSIRMSIDPGEGRHAELFIRDGRIVHASAGPLSGNDAVFELLRWPEGAAFRVEPVSSFPADNVSVPTDFLLLEGTRLLDEERNRR